MVLVVFPVPTSVTLCVPAPPGLTNRFVLVPVVPSFVLVKLFTLLNDVPPKSPVLDIYLLNVFFEAPVPELLFLVTFVLVFKVGLVPGEDICAARLANSAFISIPVLTLLTPLFSLIISKIFIVIYLCFKYLSIYAIR